MATTTTNFGWDIPQSTDLVKDGATAIAALGQDIDTALVDLKGGTTGQVLAKASGTDLDFSWVAQDDSNAIQNAIVDAKGDIITATAADTPTRLAVGTNGYVLTADSTTATGLKWAAGGASYPWTSYTPTLTNITKGNGTVTAVYQQIDKLVTVNIFFLMGSTSAMGNSPKFSLPVSNVDSYVDGVCVLWDQGVAVHTGSCYAYADNLVIEYLDASATSLQPGGISSTTPFTWNTNDKIYAQLSYQVA